MIFTAEMGIVIAGIAAGPYLQSLANTQK